MEVVKTDKLWRIGKCNPTHRHRSTGRYFQHVLPVSSAISGFLRPQTIPASI